MMLLDNWTLTAPKLGRGSPKERVRAKVKKKTAVDKDDEFLSTVSECMPSLKDAVAPGSSKCEENLDTHQQWANLLACKLRKMEPVVAEKFKLETDSRGLDLIAFD